MSAQIIPFPAVNKRTGQSPTLAELTRKAPVKVVKLTEKVKRWFPWTPGGSAA